MEQPGSGKSEADLTKSGGKARNVLQSAGTSARGKYFRQEPKYVQYRLYRMDRFSSSLAS